MFGKQNPPEMRLRVGELTDRTDYGRGIARVDIKVLQKLGVKEGDIIEIEGKNSTGALAVRAYPSDIGKKIIRIDGIVRRNAGTSIGEMVKIKKADVKDAEYVVVAPARNDVIVKANPEFFKRKLLMRPFKTGDIIIPNPVVRRRGEQDFDSFEDPFNELLKSFGVTGVNFNFGNNFLGGFGEHKFIIVNTRPKGIVRVTESTELEVKERAEAPVKEEAIPEVTYEDLGGLHEEIRKVREMIELPLKHPELFERLGIEPPKGVLLHGPPGTGKTLLAKAVANESGAHFISINGPEIMSKWYGQSEENLRKIFDEASKNAPSIIFVDEIDAIAPKREDVTGEVERRVVSQLLTLMDGLKSRGKVIVIAATNRPDAVDPALRRPGRFDREIEIGVPNKEGRKEILEIHTRGIPISNDVDLDKLANITYGYVGADLEALTKEAAMHALRRVTSELSEIKEDKPLPKSILEKLIVTKKDFDYALNIVEPSAMREVLLEIPNVTWDDIGGLEEAKKKLKESVEWPLKYPDRFKKLGIRAPSGILLYGPPGTGKTLLAKAVANESNANFIAIRGPEIMSKWVGESEKRIRDIFKKAKQVSPSIIVFDEIDSLVPARGSSIETHTERIVSQILTEISGLEELHGVVVIATTNRPDILDPALLRPGRFERQILVPTPDEKARLEIFKIYTKKMPISKDVDLKELAKNTKNYTGADIELICREAAMNALRRGENVETITKEDFEKALKEVTPSVSEAMNKFYEKILTNVKKTTQEDLDYTQ